MERTLPKALLMVVRGRRVRSSVRDATSQITAVVSRVAVQQRNLSGGGSSDGGRSGGAKGGGSGGEMVVTRRAAAYTCE